MDAQEPATADGAAASGADPAATPEPTQEVQAATTEASAAEPVAGPTAAPVEKRPTVAEANAELAAQRRRNREVDRNGFYIDEENFAKGIDGSGMPLQMTPKEVEQMRSRELKWLDMMRNWDHWMRRKPNKIKSRCRKGIPPSIRGRAWACLLGVTPAFTEKYGGKYQELVAEADTVQEGDAMAEFLEIIERDLDRTFPETDRFVEKGGDGQKMLRDVLRAYAMYNKELGYCQGMGMLAGTLLMQMPPEDAFWCLVRLLEEQLDGFFDSGLTAVQVHASILHGLIGETFPDLYAMLEGQGMTPVLYAVDWFMCCFVKTCPWATCLRIWDQLFFEGTKVLFRVALGIFVQAKSHMLTDCKQMHEQMMFLRDIPKEFLMPDTLLAKMQQVKLSKKQIAALHLEATIQYEKDHPPKPKPKEEKKKPTRTPAPAAAPIAAMPQEAVSVGAASAAMSAGGNQMVIVNL